MQTAEFATAVLNRPVPWPRKNDPASIRSRQQLLGVDGLVTSVDLEPFAGAVEALVGVAVIPVSACPITIELGHYHLDAGGALVETGRAEEALQVPLAHTEGSMTLSMTRGSTAAGTLRTHVLADRITRASCFVCDDAASAIALGRWIEAELPAMRLWLESSDDPTLSRYARLREVKTHVVGPMCHVLWAWTTGDAVGPNMMTRNSYALNMGYVMQLAPVKAERAYLEANMGGDKKPSHQYFASGHGKTVIAEAFIPDDRIERVLHTTAADLEALSWAGTHGAVASGMQSVAFTPATAIAAVFAATGQDLGMVGTSSMAQGTARRVEGGLHASIRFPGLEVGTVGGGTTLPSARDWLTAIGCAGPAKVYRFAQIVAAAALCLEISASASMATAGSANFFQAHHERGGLR
jgi:hydroxymethylglutaryl-CoA reductase (NADPH)